MTLREKLIVLRDKAGISQMALAHQIGVSRQAVSRWESGDTTPSTDKLKALAKIYDVSLDWLCNDSDKDETTRSEEPKQNAPKENGEALVAERGNNTHRLTIVIVAVAIVILAVSVIYSITRNRKNEKVNTQIEDMEQDKSGSSEEGSFDFEW